MKVTVLIPGELVPLAAFEWIHSDHFHVNQKPEFGWRPARKSNRAEDIDFRTRKDAAFEHLLGRHLKTDKVTSIFEDAPRDGSLCRGRGRNDSPFLTVRVFRRSSISFSSITYTAGRLPRGTFFRSTNRARSSRVNPVPTGKSLAAPGPDQILRCRLLFVLRSSVPENPRSYDNHQHGRCDQSGCRRYAVT